MKRLKNIYRRQISEHCGDPLAHPEYDTENVQMNYNDYEGRMAKQNLYSLLRYKSYSFLILMRSQMMRLSKNCFYFLQDYLNIFLYCNHSISNMFRKYFLKFLG